MASQEYFRFLHLPFDVRIMILRYLLPDQHFILHEAYNADCNRGPWHRPTWLTFDYNSRSPYPDILLTNRQVYSECFYHLYTIKTFKFVLHFSHIGFAYYQFLTQKHDHLRKELQPVPYHAIKEFILEIRCPDWPTTICDFRKILIMLLRRFHVEKVHFRKLRIQFPDPLGPLPGWDHAWDNAESKAWDFKPELVLDDDGDNVAHQELTAQDSGAPSTFAWFLSAFATCPSLADECIIELPESLRDKTHMQACAKRYAEGLDGRSSFHLEDECCLKQDLYDLHHKEGYREDCSCEVCDVRTMSEWTRAVHEWLLYSIRHRSAKIRWIVRHHARGAWLSCKPRYHALNKEDGCQCGFCTCYRQHKQEERVYLEMLALTAYEKEQEAGDYEEEHDDDDDDDDDQQRCQRPDHLRKQLTRYGSRDGEILLGPEREECEDCIEIKAKELRAQGLFDNWSSYVPKPVKRALRYGLCKYPRDLWESWKPKVEPWYNDYVSTCSPWLHPRLPRPEGWEPPMYNDINGLYGCDECLWENGGGWLGRNTLRASYLTRWRLLGSMVWETGCLMVKDHISSGWEDYTGMS